MNAMVLGILNYYYPQGSDYAIEVQPRSNCDTKIVDFAVRRWYPGFPADYQLANQTLVHVSLLCDALNKKDRHAILLELDRFVSTDDNIRKDC
ncbi:hypothetical protein N7520_001266 [Penicillium odoratum]|uniref:uncharacterized protein n=1 Tax=Penicillium odoratum TaxID=1167516 RepID=UPI002548820A|nr:uncharacterized protein N7520_001266 [Penicillium odoratum]KAJ5778020.1 hypothetical protein N7520_001266 [Penicillium odoratum]